MSTNGGKREGAGRKAGAAWASGKPKPIRKIARANLVGIMEGGRDPLLSLLALADDPSLDPDTRVRAYAAALPFCRPRLSMVMSADVSGDKGNRVDQAQLIGRLTTMLERLAPQRKLDLPTIEGETADNSIAKPET